jgi:hypothetical protein
MLPTCGSVIRRLVFAALEIHKSSMIPARQRSRIPREPSLFGCLGESGFIRWTLLLVLGGMLVPVAGAGNLELKSSPVLDGKMVADDAIIGMKGYQWLYLGRNTGSPPPLVKLPAAEGDGKQQPFFASIAGRAMVHSRLSP